VSDYNAARRAEDRPREPREPARARIARDAGVEIGGTLYSDAMGPPGSAAEGYIGMMRENVLTIVKALKP